MRTGSVYVFLCWYDFKTRLSLFNTIRSLGSVWRLFTRFVNINFSWYGTLLLILFPKLKVPLRGDFSVLEPTKELKAITSPVYWTRHGGLGQASAMCLAWNESCFERDNINFQKFNCIFFYLKIPGTFCS